MSTQLVERDGPGEILAGYMAAAAIFLAAIALVVRPLPLSVAALALSLVATAIGGRFARLQAFAVAAATLGFILGMTIAVGTGRPLY